MTLSTTPGVKVKSPVKASGPLRLVAGRLGFLIAALFGLVTLSFLLVSVTPGDPAELIAGPMATNEQVEAIRTDLGLDESIGTRYVDYVGGLLKGDLGESYFTKQSIASEIGDKLPATLELIILSVIFAAIVGIAVGALGAYFRGRWPDKLSRLGTGVFQAVPDFFLGLILIYFIFFVLGIAPAPSGRVGIAESAPEQVTGFYLIDSLISGDMGLFVSAAKHLMLPVLTLGLVYAAYFAKTARSTIGKALNSQQAQFARAMGLPERTVVRYAFVESRTTIVTYAGVIFASLLGGEAIVERVFAWNGIGTWSLQGITKLDLPVVQGMVLVAGAITLIVYTVLDIVVGLLDPRIKHA
ncbi:ABC transporter permease [Aeromicrobium wangtongii]|uniref:ABC transporter permease n=1 Tax=Aeromicrobium wangtongii TaxID=2969247 RepID=A0ABY5M516_9ACTN|nr:ABC transporter permease [Aeromicrobium wangtongii]MCD9198690.1 ABC transporter permease [Aeromicrobium wangtongii]MCL3819602.1 ABC transporter permease [Aeromicrobium wangtongii]UUP13264.1 ABC transporter permease [Aeromicrobium wangtongii]